MSSTLLLLHISRAMSTHIEIKAKSSLSENDKEREKKIEDGKDPDLDVLNIGEIE